MAADAVKEKAKTMNADPATIEGRTYTLPDGSDISIGDECFLCPEALFNPGRMGRSNAVGLHKTVYDSVTKCDVDVRSELLSNIVLCGGTSMFPGLQQRLQSELTAQAPANMPVNIFAPAERQFSSWIGGSVLASLSTFQHMWINKTDYDENGPTIVRRKCFS